MTCKREKRSTLSVQPKRREKWGGRQGERRTSIRSPCGSHARVSPSPISREHRQRGGEEERDTNQYASSAPCATSAKFSAALPTERSECAMTPCGGAPASRAKLWVLARIGSCVRSEPHSTAMSAPPRLGRGRAGASGRRCGCGCVRVCRKAPAPRTPV